MTSELPRLLDRPAGSRLVTRREAAEALGYSVTSLATLMGRYPQRWPGPVALLRVGRVWQMLWDADELLAMVPGGSVGRPGARATISDADGLVVCLECGKRFRHLGRHVNHAHGLTAAQYREAHRLPATGALAADVVRAMGRERMLAEGTSHLDPYRTGEHLKAMTERSVEPNRETREYETVREHRLPGQRYAVKVMGQRRRESLDARVRAAGFEGVEDAIRRTAGLPAREAAGRIGIGVTTVRRWRQRIGL